MRVFRSVRAAVVLLAALSFAPSALAVLCFRDADCPTGDFGGIRECTKQKAFGADLFFGNCVRPGACNTDSNCNAGAACILGTCQLPGGSQGSGGSSGSGTGIPGEGRHCMPADGSKPDDWAKDKFGKPLGACPKGTRCNSNGLCVRLETRWFDRIGPFALYSSSFRGVEQSGSSSGS